jgi:hypothetical protein
MKHVITSMVLEGKLEPWKGKALVAVLQKFEGAHIEITVQKYYPKISDKQNRFLHGVFLPALLEGRRAGGEQVTKEDVRQEFKERFGPNEPSRDELGRWTCEPKSIAEWTTKETEDAMEACRGHYAEFIELPIPNEPLTQGE